MLSEPVTAISDLLLAVFCLAIVASFRKFRKLENSVYSWQVFFLLMGASTFIGVIVHGFRYYQSIPVHDNTWMLMNVIAGVSIYFAQLATSRSILKNSKNGAILRKIAAAQIVVYLILILIFRSFNVVKIQVAAGMVPVMIIYFYDFKKGVQGGAWLGTGIALSFVPAVFHSLKVTISENWFNHNDISHVFIGASFALISYGISIRLKAEEEVKKVSIAD